MASVLDVGVLAGTAPLIKLFAHLPHYLFEPVEAHFSAIAAAYRDVSHQLFPVALSDEDGTAWQIGVSIDGTGEVTHSRLSDTPVAANEEPGLVECKPVKKARLDTLLAAETPPEPALLKIDVDGQELRILSGAEQTLKKTAVVVIEATVHSFLERASYLCERGFRLYDIADLAYYYDTFWQADLVFVREDIAAANPHLQPWQSKPFQWSSYTTLNREFFDSHLKRE